MRGRGHAGAVARRRPLASRPHPTARWRLGRSPKIARFDIRVHPTPWHGEFRDTGAAHRRAAEAIIRDEGYAAVSARTLADRVGLKRPIVHYYFRSIDDLLIAVIRRGAERMLARLEAAVASDEPLRAVWEVHSDPSQAALTLEWSALANRRAAVRAEVARRSEQFREFQTRALVRHLELRHRAHPSCLSWRRSC